MGIKDFLVDRTYNHNHESDKEYQKRCETRIKYLCGGFTPNDKFKKRVLKFKVDANQTNTYEKHILKYECKYGRLRFEDIESRLDELLQMDVITLSSIMADEDSSKFRTQKDIEEYMGEDYESKFVGKLKYDYRTHMKRKGEQYQSHIDEDKKYTDNSISDNEKSEDNLRRNKQAIHQDNRVGNGANDRPNNLVENFHKLQKEREEQLKREEQEKEIRVREFREEIARKRELNRQSKKRQDSYSNARNNVRQSNQSSSRRVDNGQSVPKEKRNLIIMGNAEIEIYTKVKSNTALESAALFALTGILIAEAKEEMKWVKTRMDIKDDRIIIKKPYQYHKYKDFYKFEMQKEGEFYFIGITLKDKMIILRTKEAYLGEFIVDKINAQGLSYDRVI